MKNILSLFDGISGTQQALKNLGFEFDGVNNIYHSSEIDKYAIQITQKNFPNTKQLGSVIGLDVSSLKDKIDLLSFGFPCQDLSVAKKDRKGLNGERSGLFYEALRVLKEIKPKYFLAENVASMSKEMQLIISKELFNISAVSINSALLTAQTRKRLYWVGKLNEDGNYAPTLIMQPQDKGIYLKDILESGISYQSKSHTLTATYNKAVFYNTIQKKQRTMILEPIRIGQINKGSQGQRIYSILGKSVCLSANGGGQGAQTGLYKIDAPNGDYKVRKLTIKECERLQGFLDDYFYIGEKLIVSKAQGYKALGNSFTVPVIEHILKSL